MPIAIGAALFTVMTTWRRGSSLVAESISQSTTKVETFIGKISADATPRVPGTAVFFTGRLEQTPPALQQLLSSTGVVHERVILTTVVIEPVSKTEPSERIELTELAEGFYRLILRYGFMQGPNIPSDLANCAEHGLVIELDKVHYFTGHINLLAGRKHHGMAKWRDRLFKRMATNTQDVTAHYQIPVSQAMNVGWQIGL